MADGTMRRILGSCHCGAIRIVFDRPGGDVPIPVRACGCSFCIKHGAAWTMRPKGSFRVDVAEESRRLLYRFGTRTADFHVCLGCGVVPVVTCAIDGRRYGMLNVNTFEDVDAAELARSSASFDGEGLDDRLARRARNWTPEVGS